jgi:mono/diheme cytochrome c family protein
MMPRTILAALVVSALPASAQALGDAANGELIARQWCGVCHATEATDTGADVAPAWRALAPMPDLEARLRALLADPAGPMRHLGLADSEIADLVAYIRSLGSE